MSHVCPECQTIHPSNASIAIGRFMPGGAYGYIANVPGAPIRDSREQANNDYCLRHRQGWSGVIRNYRISS